MFLSQDMGSAVSNDESKFIFGEDKDVERVDFTCDDKWFSGTVEREHDSLGLYKYLVTNDQLIYPWDFFPINDLHATDNILFNKKYQISGGTRFVQFAPLNHFVIDSKVIKLSKLPYTGSDGNERSFYVFDGHLIIVRTDGIYKCDVSTKKCKVIASISKFNDSFTTSFDGFHGKLYVLDYTYFAVFDLVNNEWECIKKHKKKLGDNISYFHNQCISSNYKLSDVNFYCNDYGKRYKFNIISNKGKFKRDKSMNNFILSSNCRMVFVKSKHTFYVFDGATYDGLIEIWRRSIGDEEWNKYMVMEASWTSTDDANILVVTDGFVLFFRDYIYHIDLIRNYWEKLNYTLGYAADFTRNEILYDKDTDMICALGDGMLYYFSYGDICPMEVVKRRLDRAKVTKMVIGWIRNFENDHELFVHDSVTEMIIMYISFINQ